MVAVTEGKADDVLSLLEAGAKVNFTDYFRRTALMHAAGVDGNDKAVELLLKAGADTKLLDRSLQSALMYAVRGTRTGAVEQLLQAGADVNWPDDTPSSPLLEAVQHSTADMLQTLIDAGANMNQPDLNGRRAIIIAAQNRQVDLIRILLKAGADVNVQVFKSGVTALMACALTIETNPTRSELCLQCAKLLVEAGANLDAEHLTDRLTVLTLAIICGKYDLAEYLIERGAKVNLSYDPGLSPLQCAVRNGAVGVVSRLLEASARVTNELYLAIEHRHSKLVQVLIKHGVMPFLIRPSEIRIDLKTPLSPLAVCLLYSRLDIARYLVHIRYLTTFDTQSLHRHPILLRRIYTTHLHYYERPAHEDIALLSNPWTLLTLSFVVVSNAIGFGPEREVRVKTSGLPSVFQEQLMYKGKTADTDVEKWDSLEI